MLKLLTNSEKINTKEIWEKIFTEDSKKFLDYYYSEKTKDNEIIVKLIKNEIVSMVHLNPYKIFINNKLLKSYYIVAVATLENHRKKGYMAEILNFCLNFMNDNEIPFSFLRPAKEEIYLPFGFNYIYNHNFLKFKENLCLEEVSLTEEKYQFLANFINDYLKHKFNVFSKRTKEYISTLHKEVKSENGDIKLLYENSTFIGCYIYWGLDKKIIRAIFTKDNLCELSENKPLVMARIININSFFKNITSKNGKLMLTLNINDPLIKTNNGLFQIEFNTLNSTIKKIDFSNDIDILYIDISNLTSVCFGYKKIEEFTNNKNIIEIFKNINLYNVFLDEEV